MSLPDPKAAASSLAALLSTDLGKVLADPTSALSQDLATALTDFQQATIAAIPPPPVPPPPVPFLRRLLPAGCNPKIGIHTMQWFHQNPPNQHTLNTRNADGTGGVFYDSASPTYLASLVKMYVTAGADFAMCDWYGLPGTISESTHGDAAFKGLLAACAGTPLKAGICIDKGAAIKGSADPTAAFIKQATYVMNTYAGNPAFFTDFLIEFDCTLAGVDWSRVHTAFPNLLILHTVGNATSPKFFTWGVAKGVAYVLGKYADPNCYMGEVHLRFNDEALFQADNKTTPNFNASLWTPSAVPSVRHYNRTFQGDEWFKLWAGIPTSMKYVQLITGQDAEEGTNLEPILSIATGVPLVP